MAETHHLQKRGQTWHYYRRVPTVLVPVVGKTFVKKSLGTSDLKEAKILRNALNVQIDAEFAAAEAQGDGAPPPAPVSLAMLTEHLRQHIAGLDQRSAARLVSDPPETETEKAEMKQDAEIGLGVLKNRDDPRGDEWVASVFDKVTAQAGASLSDKEVVSGFAEIVRRGLMELQHRKLDRLQDDHGAGPHDPLFDAKKPPAMTFGDLCDVYWNVRSAELAANQTNEKRGDRIAGEIALLREALGKDTPLTEITYDRIQEFRALIARVPTNRNKIFPGLTLQQQIDRAEKAGKNTLSIQSQRLYLRCLHDVLEAGRVRNFMPNKPATGVKPLQKEKETDAEKRLPWDMDQVKGFFEGKFYHLCASDLASYTKKDRAWRFWMPLLMLYSGARPNEIAQLHCDDVRQTDAGIWYFSLSDEDGKTLKTGTSRRRVPLHPELIQIGFLEFVEARRKKNGAKEPRIFSELKPDKYGSLAAYASKRIRDTFIPEEITLKDKQTFYSLRHNVRDALRRVKAPADTLLAVCGWSPAGKAVSDDYGDGGNPDLHAEYVEAIDYPGLDLSFLYGVGAGI
ncbi:site-specific integrase [Ruegeria pomeroyi]|uniref:site-specific integrase n=1 Tax=Ruegeria pomeroyi TaxID=89184 RepID=UPI001F26438B|nr:site-specific integrase [Ruegeria pomeroyi]MCE8510993.1 site-specific integrase [Ruegeria pomeroyi]